jgi:tetratricopeptide (TPR) repeat protein
MAYEEILFAEQGKPLETPGVMVVDKDRMADIATGIQEFLGDEVVPITQPFSVPTSEPGVPTMTKTELVSYWIQRGYEMEESKDPAAAVDCYDEALRLDPQSYVANFNKGNALVALSKFREAIQAYDKALAVKNAAEAILNREIVRLLAAGVQWPDGPKALEFLEDDLDNSDRKTQLGAALLLFMECKEEHQQACDILGVAMQQDPSILEDLKELEVPNR